MVLFAGSAAWVSAASLSIETFGGTNTSGWQERDIGEMDVFHDYLSGEGALHGVFAEQDISFTETDAFRATALSSGGAFAGNYWTDVPTFGSWSFSFLAQENLPSDLIIRFGDGTNTFFRSVLGQVASAGSWFTVNVPLTYDVGWVGGGGTSFSNALSSVSFVDVQLTRSGKNEQSYWLDNFSLNQMTQAIPEPSTAGLLLASLAVLRAARRRSGRARQVLSTMWHSGAGQPAAGPASHFAGEPASAPHHRGRRRRKQRVPLLY